MSYSFLDAVMAVTPSVFTATDYSFLMDRHFDQTLASLTTTGTTTSCGGELKVSYPDGTIFLWKLHDQFLSTATTMDYLKVIITYTGSPESHSNVVLIDHQRKTIELFEPHGEAKWSVVVLATLQKVLPTKILGYRCLEPLNYGPRTGVQARSGDAYCASWTLLYLATRLNCPTLTREQVLAKLLVDPKTLLSKWNSYVNNHTQRDKDSLILHAERLEDDIICYLINRINNNIIVSMSQLTTAAEVAKTAVDMFKGQLSASVVDVPQLPPIFNAGDALEVKEDLASMNGVGWEWVIQPAVQVRLVDLRVGDGYLDGDSLDTRPITRLSMTAREVKVPLTEVAIVELTPIFWVDDSAYFYVDGEWTQLSDILEVSSLKQKKKYTFALGNRVS